MVSPAVVVVGSLVVDHVVWAPRRPSAGETLIGSRFASFLGGKGFNQAVAAARLGGSVAMVGCVGDDAMAPRFFEALCDDGIGAEHVQAVNGSSGVGLPLVEPDGSVSIVGVPGANDCFTPGHVEAAAEVIELADLLILQCEVPQETSMRAIELARKARVVLNAAPAGERAEVLAGHADILVVNEPELATVTGKADQAPIHFERAVELCRSAQERFGAEIVVATLAEKGAAAVTAERAFVTDGHTIDAVDATGAGDAFTAAFALALARGAGGGDALRYANAAGAVAATTAGAHPSMPAATAVESLLESPATPSVRQIQIL